MDNNQVEVFVVEQTVADAREETIRELNELQLVLVGGGYGDTVI